jgi:hypothetical protein
LTQFALLLSRRIVLEGLGTGWLPCRATGSEGFGGWRRIDAFLPERSIIMGSIPCSDVQPHRLPAKARGVGGTGPGPRSLINRVRQGAIRPCIAPAVFAKAGYLYTKIAVNAAISADDS